MSLEGLGAFTCSQIPYFGSSIAGSGHKSVILVSGIDGHTHDVPVMIIKFQYLGASFDIPQDACHVTGGCDNLSVVEEAATREISRMRVEFPTNANGNFARTQVVDGADVIQSSTCHKPTAGRVGTCHYPRRSQWNSVYLNVGTYIPLLTDIYILVISVILYVLLISIVPCL